MLKSVIIALSMYSRIPMPRVKWDEDGMKYAMCFFPLVGVILAAVMYAVGRILFFAGVPALFFSAVMTVVPVLVTGGIHLDGFLDTMDAKGSWGDSEKKLEILKDSHSGAFAVIGGLVYFTLSLGAWSMISADTLAAYVGVYVLSRAASGYAVVSFPTAKNTGLAAAFADSADKKRVRAAMLLWMTASCVFMLFVNPAAGAAVMVTAAAAYAYHYYNCVRNFGGITGDLAGFFLQTAELAALTACGLTGVIL